jgi:two-component system, NarL family, response regulator LiaR
MGNRDERAATLRVMIVDDHALVRSGLKFFLSGYDDLEFVAEAASGEEAVAACPEAQPHVVLMDMVMPGMGGIEATKAIRSTCKCTQVIVLTSFPEEDLVRSALAAGAVSYLLKNASAQELYTAIRDASIGRSTLAPEAQQALVTSFARPQAIGHDLTAKERSILGLMATGMTNAEIGKELFLSRSTVKNYVSNILAKLGVTTRTEAVRLSVEHHIAT